MKNKNLFGKDSLTDQMPQVGILEWIGIRSEKRAPMGTPDTVEIIETTGLVGDRYSGRSGKRAVTLIQKEHMDAVSNILKKDIDPQDTRRNLVVSAINLHALKGKQFRIGASVILEGTGDCHPCSRMEENLGAGGYNAMRGHGGLTASVVQGGEIRLGDEVRLLND